jgi:hypothetical protein
MTEQDRCEMETVINDVAARIVLDAERYQWIRSRGGSWETEMFLSGLSPLEYDREVDKARGAGSDRRNQK